MSRGSPGSLGSGGVAVHPGAGILLSVRNALTTLAACAVLALAGCGEDDATDTAAKTVTVTAAAPATTAPPPTASTQTSGASGATGTAASAGPPLPEGVVGIDGRYNLRTKGSEDDGPTISTRFTYYFEPSNATTTCSGGTCSVALRMGVKSGGSKRYTLEADPDRERTYLGASASRAECFPDRPVPARERLALRATAVEDVRGRQVAKRIDVFVTTTARCDGEAAREVVTLRGSREP